MTRITHCTQQKGVHFPSVEEYLASSRIRIMSTVIFDLPIFLLLLLCSRLACKRKKKKKNPQRQWKKDGRRQMYREKIHANITSGQLNREKK